MGKIVTFYSYKGGTGRSMALANVAWLLAGRGARVLVVDWDLEAPGLHRYFRPFLHDKELTAFESQGVIDLMVDFSQRLATPPSSGEVRDEKWYQQHADASRWSRRLLWPSGDDARTTRGGHIDFLPAGRQGDAYARRVNSFDWAGFYERCNGGAFMDAMRRSMLAYDWTLIDSRTGVSDTSGICTVQFPDILVTCFTLNFQSIDGTAAVAASARASRPDRPLRILPLPTRLDGNEEKALKAMMAYARASFDDLLEPEIDRDKYWREMGVPYFSRYAYSEKLAPFEDQVSDAASTLPAMERLTSRITGLEATTEAPPEPHRAEALAEFERVPDRLGSRSTAALPMSSLGTIVSRAGYWYRSHRPLLANVVRGAFVLGILAFVWFQMKESPASAVSTLVAGARADMAANEREHAALLIAEAAARLDPAAVVGPDNESTRAVYEGLLALQPFRLFQEKGGTPPADVAFSPNGEWIVGAAPGATAHLLRFPPQGQNTDKPAGYSAAAFSPDSRYLAVGGRNGSLNVLDVGSGSRVWQWENPDPESAWVAAVAFSPNGRLVAAGTDRGQVLIAQTETWRTLGLFQEPKRVGALSFSPDSTYLAAGGEDPNVRLWSYQTTKAVETYGPHEGSVAAMAFAPQPTRGASTGRPSPRVLATVSVDNVLHLWTQTAGNPLEHRIAGVTTMAFNPVGSLIAAGGPASVRLLRSSPGQPPEEQAVLSVPNVGALTFSADGKWLAVAGGEGGVTLWDVATRRQLQQIAVPAPPTSLAISPNGSYLAIATRKGSYAQLLPTEGRALTLPASQVRLLACSQSLQAQLAQEEWKKYFGSEPLRYTCGPSAREAAQK